jgi:hypothetical protein
MQYFIVNWALRNYYQIPKIIGLCGFLENLKLFFSLENCQDDLHLKIAKMLYTVSIQLLPVILPTPLFVIKFRILTASSHQPTTL